MSASIVGIGTWLPPTVVRNDAWPEDFGRAQEQRSGDRTFNDIPVAEDPVAAAIVMRDLAAEARDPFLGARLRHVADPATTCIEVESEAALAALREAGIAPSEVDLILGNSIVPDRLASLSAAGVAHRIGAGRATAYQLEAACASSVAGLEVADAYLRSGLARVVLIVNSHLLMRAVDRAHPASPGLGDGATALVVTTGKGLRVRSVFTRTHGEFNDAVTYVRTAERSEPPWWMPGGGYRLGSLEPQQVKLLMRDTVTYGAGAILEAARKAGIDPERLAAVCSVQPRGFFPGAIAERLGLPRTHGVSTYDRIAHLGACGPIFNLAEARATGRLAPGAFAALYAQGAGFTRAAAILEVT